MIAINYYSDPLFHDVNSYSKTGDITASSQWTPGQMSTTSTSDKGGSIAYTMDAGILRGLNLELHIFAWNSTNNGTAGDTPYCVVYDNTGSSDVLLASCKPLNYGNNNISIPFTVPSNATKLKIKWTTPKVKNGVMNWRNIVLCTHEAWEQITSNGLNNLYSNLMPLIGGGY